VFAHAYTFALILLATACEAVRVEEIGIARTPVVYGVDDRQQVYEHVEPTTRALAK
jgi:hypothetical protein